MRSRGAKKARPGSAASSTAARQQQPHQGQQHQGQRHRQREVAVAAKDGAPQRPQQQQPQQRTRHVVDTTTGLGGVRKSTKPQHAGDQPPAAASSPRSHMMSTSSSSLRNEDERRRVLSKLLAAVDDAYGGACSAPLLLTRSGDLVARGALDDDDFDEASSSEARRVVLEDDPLDEFQIPHDLAALDDDATAGEPELGELLTAVVATARLARRFAHDAFPAEASVLSASGGGTDSGRPRGFNAQGFASSSSSSRPQNAVVQAPSLSAATSFHNFGPLFRVAGDAAVFSCFAVGADHLLAFYTDPSPSLARRDAELAPVVDALGAALEGSSAVFTSQRGTNSPDDGGHQPRGVYADGDASSDARAPPPASSSSASRSHTPPTSDVGRRPIYVMDTDSGTGHHHHTNAPPRALPSPRRGSSSSRSVAARAEDDDDADEHKARRRVVLTRQDDDDVREEEDDDDDEPSMNAQSSSSTRQRTPHRGPPRRRRRDDDEDVLRAEDSLPGGLEDDADDFDDDNADDFDDDGDGAETATVTESRSPSRTTLVQGRASTSDDVDDYHLE